MNPPIFAILPPAPPNTSLGSMPIPRFLLIEHNADGFFLLNYSAQGEVAGDTWHESLDDAIQQADFEYPDATLNWIHIPHSEPDPLSYVMSRIN